jgi:O-antigen/teichoic acid export membrane protein
LKINVHGIKKQLVQLWNKGALHIFVGNFITKFVAFFGSILLVRVLSKESFGVLSYIENIYGYIYIFVGMGLGDALLRYLILEKTSEKKFGYYKYAIIKGTIFNVVLVFIVVFCLSFFQHPPEFETSKIILIIFILSLPFDFLLYTNSLTYRAMFHNKRFALIAVSTSTILIICRYIAAIFLGLNGVIYTKFAVTLFFGIILCIVTYNLYFKKVKVFILNKDSKKNMDSYSIQFMITNGLWAIFMLNDVFLLGQLGGDSNILAEYKVAYVIPGNLAIISTSIGVFFGPYFVKNEKNQEWVRKNYIKAYLVIAGLMGLTVLILFIFAKPIISILYGSQYENIVPLMRLLLIAAFVNNGLRYTSAHLLSSMGQIKYNMIISSIGIAFQIIINIILIPIYGAEGVAFTSIVVYAFMALALFIVFTKKYKVFRKTATSN